MKITALFLLLFGVSFSAVANDEWVKKLSIKGCDIVPVKTERASPSLDLPGGNYFLTTFSCASGNETSGVVLWKDQGNEAKLVSYWARKGPVPHTIAWIDFDGDKIDDLFLLSGKENVAWTEVLVYKNKNWKSIYFGDKEYAVLVDVDRDDSPDILEPATKISEDKVCANMEMTPALSNQVKDKLGSITAQFKEANISPEMFLFQETKIYRYSKRAGRMTDETSRFGNHIAWRIDILEKVLKTKDKIAWRKPDEDHAECLDHVSSVARYWKAQEEKRPKPKQRRRRS